MGEAFILCGMLICEPSLTVSPALKTKDIVSLFIFDLDSKADLSGIIYDADGFLPSKIGLPEISF